MGATQPKCMFCQNTESEDNPILEIHSRDKYKDKFICFFCMKKKIKMKIEYEKIFKQS